MTAKRQATSDLNHTNWNVDEEPEDRGHFRKAADDELKKRVIKKPHYRKPAGAAAEADGSAPKSVFSGFAGFGKATTATPTAAASPFSFLSKIPAVAASASSSGASASAATKTNFSFGGAATSTSSTKAIGKTQESAAETTTSVASNKTGNYYAKLKGLNQAVSDWIKKHVDKNPLCILTPIFKDYEIFLKTIEEEECDKTEITVTTSSISATDGKSPPFGNFKFSATTSAALSSSTVDGTTTSTTTSIFGGISKPAEAPKSNGFSFGSKSDEKAGASTPTVAATGFNFGLKTSEKPKTTTASVATGFSFGLKKDDKASDTPSTTGFTFGSSAASTAADDKKPSTFSFTPGATPFSFGNIKPPAAASSTSNVDEEEEEQPPKVEFKKVVEEDAIYSKKCKVFVKKDGNFADRGVGTLYLKPVKDSEKTQLLVRADTNLGNILVNIILSEGIPSQRMGKNNVMLVCLPTADVDKPTPMLLRVKTSDEADELLETIEKYKK